jgi:hypothetical protein
LAGHELGERESEQRKKEREQRFRGAGGGSGWLGVAQDSEEKRADSEKEREQRLSESEMSREGDACVFWKMVYGKIFRKPFSLFSSAIFRSIFIHFLLTSVLQRPKRPKMLETFYGKHFTSKQTEP